MKTTSRFYKKYKTPDVLMYSRPNAAYVRDNDVPTVQTYFKDLGGAFFVVSMSSVEAREMAQLLNHAAGIAKAEEAKGKVKMNTTTTVTVGEQTYIAKPVAHLSCYGCVADFNNTLCGQLVSKLGCLLSQNGTANYIFIKEIK